MDTILTTMDVHTWREDRVRTQLEGSPLQAVERELRKPTLLTP